ncbi:MAG TPA: hypothetical protein VKQ05_09605 [Gemmatimonadales bacterium]|nr:hypothetical protein [Gemmatimonadales bacterium]
MTRLRSIIAGCAGLLAPFALGAQGAPAVARSGAYFESYSFGDGLAFKRISEFTIPISVTQRVGQRLVIDVGTAFASASVRQADGTTINHSGLIDTDLRASFSMIPGKLIFNLVGSIPTGATAVPDTTIPLFGATATDLLGFTTPSFGSGGGISAGFASAFRMGQNWAVGTGASFRQGASYQPVKGQPGQLSPGGEARARFGIEGPFGGGKYFRGALVYTSTANNGLGPTEESGIGDRVLAYAAVSMPLGNSHLSLYGWDMRRLRARSWDQPNTISVPRGNVLALGARLERLLGEHTTLAPMVEFRHELTGPGPKMELLGYLLRTGADLRYRVSDRAAVVLQAQVAFGSLNSLGVRVPIVGPRLGALLEWSR